MAGKYQFYSDLADRETLQVTGSMGDWTGFLATAGRLYKYPFEEQLMIHAQRPDAVACAPFETWNGTMNRYVKRGSKGIALLDNRSGKPSLKYVFDVADTGDGRQNARRPFIWEMKPEHEVHVMGIIANVYGLTDFNEDMGNLLYGLAQSLSARRFVKP